jgi:hypothetical protein
MSIGIYRITHVPTNRHYIGQSKQIEFRLATHTSALRGNRHSKKIMQRAYNESDPTEWETAIIEVIADSDGVIWTLLKQESYWSKVFDSLANGFNATADRGWMQRRGAGKSLPTVQFDIDLPGDLH